ncbi:Post-GPI attachment to proteins factor 3, partial [Cucurbita argyrosperma subsp. argyrosperma]
MGRERFIFPSAFAIFSAETPDFPSRLPTRTCIKHCEETGCIDQQCFPQCKFSSDGVSVDQPWYMQEPLYIRWKQWDCQSDCRYHCMVKREGEREALGYHPVKYHGKWPFKRIYGIQLPLRQDKKAHYEFASLWHIYALFAMNSWFWSAVFHSRDVVLTEKLDYSSAVALLGFSLILAILRRWNMIVCVTMGLSQLLIWAIWAGVTHHPSRWKVWTVVVGGGLALLLEIYDFPPHEGLIDAHALWHATTIPLTYVWWSFIRDDAEFQTSNLVKKAK